MQILQSLSRRYQHQLTMILIAGGFLMLLGELLLTNHTDGTQLIAVVASLLGMALAGLGIFARNKLAVNLALAFLLLTLTGLFGTYEHLEEGLEESFRFSAQPVEVAMTPSIESTPSSLLLDEEEEEGEETEIPPLAPMSLSGFSLLGAVMLFSRKESNNTAPVTAQN